MEPRIQYAKTSDGVSIAFWTLGEGIPLVILPFLVSSHIQIEWQGEVQRAFYERLAERAMVIRYDCRGLGMSQRDTMDFSLETAERDLAAVVDRLGLERFAILGATPTGGIRFAYPARQPERVSHLVVPATTLLRATPDRGRQFAAIEPLMEREWDLYVEIYWRLISGWDSPNAASSAARSRASHSPSSFRLALEALDQSSPEPFLGAIQSPTLILHRLGNQEDSDAARMLAAGIPSAHVVGIPGLTVAAYQSETAVAAILDFISSAPTGLPIAPPQIDTSAVRTILFTDVEGSTALTQRLGDTKARQVLREHERVVRECLKTHGGSEVKAMGDGFMTSFGSAARALECAVAIQRASAHPVADGDAPGREPVEGGTRIRVRIGLNAGEPIAEEDDLFGTAVIAAARIAAQAQGGEILVSNVVRELVAGKGFLFSGRGKIVLRGFDDPVEVYEVRWEKGD